MTTHVSLTFWFLDYQPTDKNTPLIDDQIVFWEKVCELLHMSLDMKQTYISWSPLKQRECLTLHLTLKKTVTDCNFAYKIAKSVESLAQLQEDNSLYASDCAVQFYD